MSILGKTVPLKWVGLLALVMVVALGAMLPALSAPVREVTLVTRGMAFYLEGDRTTPNPTIEVRAGERVRVVLRNEERGIGHDFAVPAFEAATRLLDWNETDDVVFDVPDTPGLYEYVCRPHLLMMRGTMRVVAE